jgi:phosphatidylserine/phosphatidylglycerophosphate/cardiolipin synthase-like enzyme
VSTTARTIRIGDGTGIRIRPLLRSLLLAELLSPSPQLWLVSPWITDVDVIDNAAGEFDAAFGDDSITVCRLSDALGRICADGAELHIVTRPDRHNDQFVERLTAVVPSTRLTVSHAPEVHEKTFCGRDWMLTGSMNFTIRGLVVNDEAVLYSVGGAQPGQARLDLERRWGGGAA